MTTEHTAGPWEALVDSVEAGGGTYVGQAPATVGASHIMVGGTNRGADARLIAAAPDLLEALKGVMHLIEVDSVNAHLKEEARGAIAKAEGKSG